MVIAKQMDVRANIKKYFDMAYEGEPVVVPRKENKNVMIISEELYNELMTQNRMTSYAGKIEKHIEKKKHSKTKAVADVRAFNMKKLEAIAGLKDGWNGNGAPAIPKKLIDHVRTILDEMMIQPEIFPTALQTIQFEFDNTRRDHMEIEIGLEETAEVFLVRYDGAESFEDIPNSAEGIDERVRAFYG